ncbi:PPE family protein [Mycobacterium sp. TY815]|uniref:PPE family protein n=1 Tax=Mycobacterium sp. TY815 TaxID=3050581 RepID=UPI002741F4B6|nr:PPE family protein [Mycobacterium sp. TY815]MDP7705920.1 PPE family protein [Mycobacterium sp. TY815]
MGFEMLAPEVNSARMYGGAGAGPLFSAAAAWDGVAAELQASASSFDSVIADLIDGSWAGSAAAAMVGIASGYVGWLSASSGIAEMAGMQARAAATAYEAARSATVHPAEVAANRMQQLALIATNFLGQNTPAIAATDFVYVDMWVQDVLAMVGYLADAVSVAVALTPFSALPADLAGMASQAVAVAQAIPLDAVSQGVQLVSTAVGMAMTPLSSFGGGAAPGGAALAGASESSEVPLIAAAGATRPGGGAGFGAAAGLGQARTVGALSVPQSWVGSVPEARGVSALPGTGLAGAATLAGAEAAAGAGAGMPMMPMPTGGGANGGMPGRIGGGASPHVVQQRPSVIPRVGV